MTTAYNPLPVLPSRRPLSRVLRITCWVLQGLAALAFLGAGVSKLAGAPEMVDMFAKLGAGQWFRYLTGTLEVIGAVALLFPKTIFYGAALLAVVMVGAIVAHLTVLGGNPSPPFVLLLIVGVVAYFRRPTFR